MKLRNLYRPYVRRATGRERPCGWLIKIELDRLLRRKDASGKTKPYYVMVNRGFPNFVTDVGRTKREAMRKRLYPQEPFRKWAKGAQEFFKQTKPILK